MIRNSMLVFSLGLSAAVATPVLLIDYDDGISANGIHDANIRDGGFEDAAVNAPLAATPSWSSYFAEGSTTPAILDSGAHTGTKHAISSGYAGSGNRVHPSQAFSATDWTIQAGDVFTVHLWGKSWTNFDAGADALQVIIHVIDASGAAVADSAHGENGADRLMSRDLAIPQAGTWTELSATSSPVAANSPWIGKRIQIRFLNTGDRNELATIDDVTFTADHNPVIPPPVAVTPIDVDPVDQTAKAGVTAKPNIVFIYADDLGFGDISCQGATAVSTPNIDSLAAHGVRFTDAHSAAPTCTPSRYSILTGAYAWRTAGTGILAGNAGLIIRPGSATLPGVLRQAGYQTAAVGKWHLGLGNGTTDFTKPLKPGPLEVGFDYFFGLPATADRVPCVYIENHDIYRLNPDITQVTPLQVSYGAKIGNEPTFEEIPVSERNTTPLLRSIAPYIVPGNTTYQPSSGHNQTIINGVSRIGYMTGAQDSRWKDEDMAGQLVGKAGAYIQQKANTSQPFFLYFATSDIHVPRVPNSRFVGTSQHGIRGDAIHQLDWQVGEILKRIEDPNGDGDPSDSVANNTLVIFTSDNGPVLNDGYADGSGSNPGNQKISGPYKGGKYSANEGGHRIPFIVRWPGVVAENQVSAALISQTDLMASFAALIHQPLPTDAAQDSQNILPALLGKSPVGRSVYVAQEDGAKALRWGSWKSFFNGALYQLDGDPGETTDIRSANATTIARINDAYVQVSTAPKISPLAAWWPLDEASGDTARDLSNSRHSGALEGTPARLTEDDKRFLRFDGSAQSVHAAGIPAATDNFTVSLWARGTDSTSAGGTLISRPGQFSLDASTSTKKLSWNVSSPSGLVQTLEYDASILPGFTVTDWHHFAATFNASNGIAALYIDGVKRKESTFEVGAPPASDQPVSLAVGAAFFKGDLSDVRIYTAALNAQRLLNAASGRLLDEDHDGILDDWEYLYDLDAFNGGNAIEDPDLDGVDNFHEFLANTDPMQPDGTPPAILLSHLKFDETSGTAAADASGANHSGTLSGVATWTTEGDRHFLSFDGVDDAVEIANIPDLAAGVTAAIWARSDTPTWNIAGSLLARREQWVLHPWKNTTRLSFMVVPADTGAEILADFDLGQIPGFSITDWHHYAGSYDSATGCIRLYVDGHLRQTSTLSPVRLKSQTTSVFVGKDGIQSRFFGGDLDDARVYSGALDESQIGGLVAADLAASAPAEDFDRDGRTNLEEATAGTDPTCDTDFFKILDSGPTGHSPQGFSTTVSAKPGRIYSLEESIDLAPPWTEVTRQGPFDTTREIQLVQPLVPKPKAFYRVRVSAP